MTKNAYPYYDDALRETRVEPGDGSQAEAVLYNLLRQQLPENWYFIWGSQIGTEHEYDFLVMVPGYGIVNVECKGWGYKYVGGREQFKWYNKGNGKWEGRNPLEQAARAKNGYIRYLQNALFGPGYCWGLMGACVVFPLDEHEGCNWKGQPLYRKSDCAEGGKGLEKIVLDALDESKRVVSRNPRVRQVRCLSEEDALRIWKFWTQNEMKADSQMPPKLELSTYREHMRSFLTIVQDQALQRILGHTGHALLVTGGAGTGKTIIAMAAAAQAEGRVLYVCYNKVLAGYVSSVVPDKQGLTVSHFHGLPEVLLGHRVHCQSYDEFDEAFLEEVFALQPGRYTNYDLILVDEAQDISEVQLLVLMRFLKHSTGKIVFFSDRGQTLYDGRMSNEDIKKMIGEVDFLKLNVNMRNPKQVVAYCNDFAESPITDTTVLLDGADVVRKTMKLAEVDQFLIDEVLPRYEPSDIAVISPNGKVLESVGRTTAIPFRGPDGDGKTAKEITKNLAAWRANKCAWKSTTHSFKGMEAMAVVHIVPANQHFDNLLYVGGSRATYQLFVIELEGE